MGGPRTHWYVLKHCRYRSPMVCLIVSRQSALAGTGQASERISRALGFLTKSFSILISIERGGSCASLSRRLVVSYQWVLMESSHKFTITSRARPRLGMVSGAR
jgi:hypothetical protein